MGAVWEIIFWLSGVFTGIVIMLGANARSRYRQLTRVKRERLAAARKRR